MNSKIIFCVLQMAVAMFMAHSASAIKIVVPDQYKDQVEAIKKAERTEREQELEGVAESAEGSIQIAGEDKPERETPAVDADEFLVQSVIEATDTAAAIGDSLAADEGIVSGQVVDKETGEPVSGAAILIEGTDIATVTDETGRYSLGPAPAGDYTLSFIKSGYIEANVTDYKVAGGEVSVFPFAMPPRPAEMSDEVYELQDFTVTAEQANDLMMKLEIRMDSSKMLDIMSSEEFSKFAAGDVGDAVKRIVGVSVIEGQFAVIRGLEDRYSSTLLNGASIPSPDPDKQSVQLDLFSTDVVSNLQVAKSFTADQPGNSAGGTIDINTAAYPEEVGVLDAKISAGTGFNSNSMNRFIEVTPGLAVGQDRSRDPVESDLSFSAAGRYEWGDLELRFITSYSKEIDYDTQVGTYDVSAAGPQRVRVIRGRPSTYEITPGSLSFGQLPGKDPFGKADYTQSEYRELESIFIGGGMDIDPEGNHKLDGFYFKSKATEENGELRENYSNPVGPSPLDPTATDVSDVFEGILNVPTANAKRFQSRSIFKERELEVKQVRGVHTPAAIEGLKVSWNVSRSTTSQDDAATQLNYWFEPFDVTSPSSGNTAPSSYHAAFSQVSSNPLRETSNSISEQAEFYRIDLEYDFELSDSIGMQLSGGASNDEADRDVDSRTLLNLSGSFLAPQQWFESVDSPLTIDQTLREDEAYFGANRVTSTTTASRDNQSRYISSKLTFFKKFDIIGGLRQESININTVNEPFLFLTQDQVDAGVPFVTLPDGRYVQAETFRGVPSVVPAIYPSVLLMFEKAGPGPADGFPSGFGGFDNPALLGNEDAPDDVTSVDQLLGLLNGEIKEDLVLPNIGFAYRPIDGMRFSVNYNETAARPSFRELGYYLSAPEASDDLVIGNPQLDISEVKSLDFRFEYSFGSAGDLFAISLFQKDIDNPIESIRISDPLPDIQYQTFYNNPNTAELRGLEIEFSKVLDFTPIEYLKYFTFGANGTYIDASIDRSEYFVNQYALYFVDESVVPDPNSPIIYTVQPGETALEASRRMFNQPEWIANANLTFNQPEWGTSVTLAYFAISDILESVGSVGFNRAGSPTRGTTDRYIDSFHQLDLIITQKYKNWTFKFSAKNITDSTRKLVYDPDLVDSSVPPEREYKVGRDYSFSASYAW